MSDVSRQIAFRTIAPEGAQIDPHSAPEKGAEYRRNEAAPERASSG